MPHTQSPAHPWIFRYGRRAGTATAVAAVLLTGVTSASAAPNPGKFDGYDFVSRPDLHPPIIDVTTPANGVEPGHTFVTPAPAAAISGGPQPKAPVQPGPMIVDDAGQPVWFAPVRGGVSTSLEVQQYQGKPVLTWWEGQPIFPPGIGKGHYVIADESYRPIATVNAGNGLAGDLHDFTITPQNTALLTAQREIRRDLSGIGGPKDAKVLEGVVQEVDIASGRVLMEWHSGDYVAPEESFEPVSPNPAVTYNYFHINSVALDGDGNLLVSARNTSAVYQVNRQTGAVNWRLGGKKNDFRMGKDATFGWQHDVRRQPDGTISLFDNTSGPPAKSRVMSLRLDDAAKSAELTRENLSPDGEFTPHQGSAQPLANGHVFAGWGAKPHYTEFGPDGGVRLHASFRDRISSYRAFRFQWVGHPAEAPAVAAQPGPGTSMGVFTSWNGDTEVRVWRVLTGPDAQHLHPAVDAPRSGFETKLDVGNREAFVATQGLDAGGNVLATSPVVQVAG